MARLPSLSMALVTRNRPESLARTLESVRGQQPRPFEVVVSDDSDDGIAPRVREIVERFGFGFSYRRGPRRGLYANRNWCALACSGSHIRTVDDDHLFPPGHLEAVMRAVDDDPRSVWIIGECSPAREGSGDEWKCPGQLHPRGFSVTPPDPSNCWAIADGASVYPRSIFDSGLRFDQSFPFGISYLEWGSRLHRHGIRIRHLSTTYIIHDSPPARSFDDQGMELGSRVCAMLAHSIRHQPSLRNRALSAAEIARIGLVRGAAGRRSVLAGVRAYHALVRSPGFVPQPAPRPPVPVKTDHR